MSTYGHFFLMCEGMVIEAVNRSELRPLLKEKGFESVSVIDDDHRVLRMIPCIEDGEDPQTFNTKFLFRIKWQTTTHERPGLMTGKMIAVAPYFITSHLLDAGQLQKASRLVHIAAMVQELVDRDLDDLGKGLSREIGQLQEKNKP
jgi:hypothetical protein